MRSPRHPLYNGPNHRFWDPIGYKTNQTVGHDIMDCTTEKEALRYLFVKILARLELL